MINILVSRKYEEGTAVELVERYKHLAVGWHGTVKEIGITEDLFFHEYAIEDSQGNVEVIPGNIVRPYIKASRENVVDVFNHMSIFIDDEDELKDFKKVYSIIERDFNSPFTIAVASYAFGKTVGKRQDRLNRKRKHLMKKYPDMRESTQEASHKVIEMISKMEKLSSEDLEEFIQYLHGKRG